LQVAAELAGFAALLFLTRFVLRSHLIPLMDQECHIGGIAVDVLAHGVRFPLLAYAPNEYDNGSFLSGLLTAISFSLLGRSVLALKLVTHLIAAAGAVGALWLLRSCLDELGVSSRRARWAATAVLVIGIASAPRIVTLWSMYAVGNHAEGSAIDIVLLALFARLARAPSAGRTAVFWTLAGFALYLNKGTLLAIPVLAAAEVALARRAAPRLCAALGGFLLGVLPELLVIAQRHAAGWYVMRSKPKVHGFPQAFLADLSALGEHRIGLLALWAASLIGSGALLVRLLARRQRLPPVAVALVLAFTCLHLAALTIMAQGPPDPYSIYGYATAVVLFGLLVGWACAGVEARWGRRAAALAGAAATAVSLFVNRPDALAWRPEAVAGLWRDTEAAVCSWRFAEGFEREHQYGLAPPGMTRERYAIERCRLLSEPDQVLGCIGGMARELNWRRDGRVDGEPPAGLTARERRTYAYYWGTHRMGSLERCSDFDDPELAADCAGAVELECLVFTDVLTRLASGRGLARPRCLLRPPPANDYWAAMRRDFLARPPGARPDSPPPPGRDDLRACRAIVAACYPPPS
jgi:hypothetical protein